MTRQTDARQAPADEPIAIVGLGCRFAGGADSPEEFWRILRDGMDVVTGVPPGRGLSGGWGSFLPDVDRFDPAFFGISAREAVSMDPQQRLFLEVAWEALEHAGLPADRLAGSPTGVFLGVYNCDYAWLQGGTAADPYSGTGAGQGIAANRLSYLLDLRGPSLAVDATCASSLVAVHLACQSLRSGDCDLAIAGGVNLTLSPEVAAAVAQAVPLAADGRCKPFDASADGIVRGEGCGVVVLKRLADARADGDARWAMILGSAVNQDGRSNGFTAPNPAAQEQVIRSALRRAGVDPRQLSYVEAHGTGTPLGDPIEVEALAAVYGRGAAGGPRCRIGSVKSNLGHLEAAAGVAGLIKTVLALGRRVVPATLHLRRLNPAINLHDTRLELPTTAVPWPNGDGPRYAAVSSFSLGGTNAHIVLGEAEPQAATGALPSSAGELILPLSARDEPGLRRVASRWAAALRASADDPVAARDLCYTAGARRTHHDFRLAVTGASATAVADCLDGVVRSEPRGGLQVGRADGRRKGLAFLFSGYGSEWVGMGRNLRTREPAFRDSLSRCDEVIRRAAGWSLLDELLADPPHSRLDRADVGLPALTAVQVALTELWGSWGVVPDAVLGHSAGEVAAAYAAGAFDLEDALRIALVLGRALQAVVGRGYMAAVDLSPEDAERFLAEFEPRVTVAAVNTPRASVLSGDAAAMDRVTADLARRGVGCRRLPYSGGFHSPVMDEVLGPVTTALAGLTAHPARCPILSSTRGGLADPDLGPAYWAGHLRHCVRFADAMGKLIRDGYRLFVEIAPHAILSGHAARALADAGADGLVSAGLRRGGVEHTLLLQDLGRLYVAGWPVEWTGLYPDGARVVPAPTYPWQRERFWLSNETGSTPPTPRGAALEADPEDLYEVAWEHDGAGDDAGSTPVPAPEVVAEGLAPELTRLASETGLRGYRRLEAELDRASGWYVRTAFAELGWAWPRGAVISAEHVVERQGIAHRYGRLVHRLLEILAEDGVLDSADRGWRVARDVTAGPGALDVPDLLARFADHRAEIELLARCGPRLADVLRGRCSPLELLFPGGSSAGAEALYRDTAFARTFNALTADAVSRLVAGWPAGRPVRVLEVGAGTGGTTAALLDRLPAGRTDYVFTDVSPLFLARARERFRHYPFLDYRRLDLTIPPAEQGFAEEQFDLVIASNVLHATADLRQSLGAVRRLLAPGGVLVLLEATGPQRLIDLTFGLTDDWWSFTDTDVRLRHPLLPAPRWVELLRSEGFSHVAVVPDGPKPADDWQTALFLARLPVDRAPQAQAAPPDRAGRWVVFADATGVGQQLAGVLRERGGEPVLVLPGSAFESAGADRYIINPSNADDYLRLTREVLAPPVGPPARGVIHLWNLDHSTVGEVPAEELAAVLPRTCGSLLALTQVLAMSGGPVWPRLWVVTAGAASADDAQAGVDPWQAPAWGLGTVIAAEHPELWGGLIDVGADLAAARATAIADALGTPGTPDWVAYRSGRRMVARLQRSTPHAARDLVPIRPDASYLIAGGLGGLGREVARWLVARGARHLILVGRSGADRPDAAEFVRELEKVGTRILVGRADVARADELAAVWANAAIDFPPIAGVVHAAGIFDDRVLLRSDWGRFDRVFAAKVKGAWNLHQLSRQTPLDFFILFASAATQFGLAGLGNYTAANAFLDALAHHRRRLGLPALSIDWGGWDSAGMADAMGQQRRDQLLADGLRPLAPEEGVRVLARVLGGPAPQVVVAPMDWDRWFSHPERRKGLFRLLAAGYSTAPPTVVATGSEGAFRDRLEAALPGDRVRLLTDHLEAHLSAVLNLEPRTAIDPDRPLPELGLDSLLAMELRNRLVNSLGRSLPATVVFDYPTVTALVGYLLDSPAAAEEQDDTDLADILAELEGVPVPPRVEGVMS
jgi:acyl transferase domain-containing protein